MDRFQRLLVYLPSDQPVHSVARAADELARQNEAAVTLVDVVDAAQGVRAWGSQGLVPEMEEALTKAAAERLGQVAKLFDHVEPDIQIRSGVGFVEVIYQVYVGGHDIVLVGSHPRSTASARLDPTLAHLLRKCPSPVWVVDESHRKGEVLVAVGPEYDDEARTLNRTLIEMGSSLAERIGSGLHLVHAWKVAGESLLFGSRVSISREQVDELISDAERMARDLIDSAVADVPLARDADIHLLHGRPEQQLVDIVEKLEPGVVVMGTVARKGIAGLIVGNTAERVLSTIDASLLAVKPPWFVSPVPPPVELSADGLD
jgi:universal stress protein E